MKKLLRNLLLNSIWHRAERVLAKDQPIVIAVTGSIGKTTTKEAIGQVLAAGERAVRLAPGNLNTEFGVPLAILGQKKAPRGVFGWLTVWLKTIGKGSVSKKPYYLVLEYSSDKPGDIAYLAGRVKVDVAVFTRFTLTHGRTVEEVTKEKLALLKGLKNKGVAIFNADDPAQTKTAGALSYGQALKADIRWKVQDYQVKGMVVAVAKNKEVVQINTRLVAEHQAESVAAAMAAAAALGLPWAAAAKALDQIMAPAGRMRLIDGRKEITIIDDSYNSSPSAALAALNTLRRVAGKRRAVAILGNMNELGDHTVSAHVELGQAVGHAKIDFLIAVGQNATRIIRGAREAGLPDQHMIAFKTPEKLIKRLDNLIQSNDVILVKASQNGMRFERVTKQLMKDPKQAKELLVRQDH